MSSQVLDFEPVKATERQMLDLLWDRYAAKSQATGRRYVMAEHVRNTAGFDASNTADAIVIDTWNSSGWAMHGFEVKVSRSDWLTELKKPWKSEAFRPHLHHWWLAVSDPAIVRDDLPEGWGLLVMRGGRLVQAVAAPRQEPDPMPRSMQVSLLRATMKTGMRHPFLAPVPVGSPGKEGK